MCSKVAYTERYRAEQAAHRAKARTGGDLIQPYYCCSCDAWHLGHPPGSGRLNDDRKKRRRKR